MPLILIADDDAHIRELVRHHLERAGFGVLEAKDGVEALRQFDSAKVDMLIVDIMMPGLDGFHVCREIRALSSVPLLMLTALGETSVKVQGFQTGIDDYLVKPFDPQELLVRVQAILRRYRIHMEQVVQIGHLQLDQRAWTAILHDKELSLPRKEFSLLFLLASHAGQTLTRERLIEDIWGFDYAGDERTVDVHVKRLRERFRDANAAFGITTVRGLGYRLETY